MDEEKIKDSIQEDATTVVEEAKEVLEEAKATLSGQSLKTDAVGEAGYRAPNNASGKATASLVLGIIGIVSIFFGWFSIVGLVCAIVGLIMGAQARKENQSSIATAGFVCSIVGLALAAIGLVCWLCALGTLAAIGASGTY